MNLAEQNAEFKRVLDQVSNEQIDRFSTLIGILLGTVGTEQTVLQAVNGKIFELMRLPDGVDEILTDTRSVEITLKWYQSLGESEHKFATLVRLGIHHHKQPNDLNPEQLDKLLYLDNKTTTSSLLSLDEATFAQAISLPKEDLRDFALRMNPAGWQTFAWYRQQLVDDSPAQAHFTQIVLKQPHTLAVFDPHTTRLFVMNAQDKINAINKIAGLSSGFFGGLLGYALTLLQWVVGIGMLLFLIRIWPTIRLLLYSIWALLMWALGRKQPHANQYSDANNIPDPRSGWDSLRQFRHRHELSKRSHIITDNPPQHNAENTEDELGKLSHITTTSPSQHNAGNTEG